MTGTSLSEFVATLKRPLVELPDPLAMVPCDPFGGRLVTVPASKSLTNRALLLGALSDDFAMIFGPLLDADDAVAMIEALGSLGVGVHVQMCEPATCSSAQLSGCAGMLRGNCAINLNNAGTATRFLTAAACLADGPVEIDGNPRMRQRPIGELVAMLRQLGVRIDELGAKGCVPLRVHPCRPKGGMLHVPTTLSSQYVSAVMMVAPYFGEGLQIIFDGPVTSPSYIEMTRELMRRTCGVRVEGSVADGSITVYPGPIKDFDYTVERDASAATYFAAAAVIVPESSVGLEEIHPNLLQADARFAEVLGEFGADWEVLPTPESPDTYFVSGTGELRGAEADLSLMPDTAMTLAAVACFAQGTTTIKGLRTLRVKETDRIAAMATELRKLGIAVEVFSYTSAEGIPDEGMRITPPKGGIDCSPSAPPVVFDTYDDHRMAMSLALIGLRRPNVAIRDPACVAKTYPTYWSDLARLYEK